MKYRIGIGVGSGAVDPIFYAEAVHAVAASEFDSIWVSEVLTAPGPDVMVALTAAAYLEPKLKFGTTMLLPGRNPVRLAKSLATLDVLSGGRLLVTCVPGLARGAEREAIGVPVGRRGPDIERTLPLLRRWWAGEEVDGITVRPVPVQQPLECWLGGIAPSALARCGRSGDGWLTSACTPGEARAGMRVITETADAAGRSIDPEHFGVSIGYSREPLPDEQLAALSARVKGRGIDPRSLVPVGLSAVRETVLSFMDAGLSKFVLRPMPSALPWPDELESLAAAVGDLQT